MSIQTTTTYKDMLELMQRPAQPVFWRLTTKLFANGLELLVSNTLNMVSIADYESRYYADIFITISVDPVVKRRVLENLQTLEVEVVRQQQSVEGDDVPGVYKQGQRFNAYVTDPTNPALMGLGGIQGGQGDSVEQISQLENITLQLVEPVVAEYRALETGGIFGQSGTVDLQQVLRYTMGLTIPKNASKGLLESGQYLGIRGVDVVKPDNTRKYDHIVIPSFTRLTSVPKYLQENYGIYASGLGWHIERSRCFVYPLMDYTQYQKRHKVLTVLNVPVNEAPTMERTFFEKGKEIFVFATGDVGHVDESENVQQNVGNGIRYSLAGNLLDDMCEVKDNKVNFKQSDNVKGLVIDERPRKDNVVRRAELGFTDNPYRETSRLALGIGTRLSLRWDNSNKDLLYPGMPVKVLYKSDGKVKSLLGVLVGTVNQTTVSTDSILDNRFTGTTLLNVHVQRVKED